MAKCDPDTQDCKLMREFGITKKVERNFKLVGVQAWIRSFLTPFGLVSWLPEAITWVRAQRDNETASQRFLFTTKYWSHIMGWLTFPVTMFIAAIAIDPYLVIYDDDEDDKLLMSPSLILSRRRDRGGGGRRRRNGGGSQRHYGNYWWTQWYYNDDWDEEDDQEWGLWVLGQVFGVMILVTELSCWIMFYVGFKDALLYGDYLAKLNESGSTSDNSF